MLLGNQLSSNIRKLQIIKICRGFLFSVGIFLLFFNKYNLGEAELFIVQAIYSITVVIFEIPTGFISDKYSRKISISIGLLIGSISLFLYFISHGFRQFVVAEFLLAIGTCFISGSDTALLYDTMQQIGKEKSFKKTSGLLASSSNRAEAAGGIIGGFVGVYSLSFPFLLDGMFAFIAFLISLTLIEPKIHRFQEGSSLSQIKSVVQYTLQHQKIFLLMLFSGFMGTITLSMVWFSQPFLKLNNVPVQYFGLYRAISNLAVGLFAMFAHKIEEYFGSKRFMLLLICISFISIVCIGLYPVLYMLPLFLIFQFVRGGSRVIVQDELHVQTDSKMRATIQSINNMFFRLCFAIFGPMAGYLSGNYGIGVGLFFIGIVLCSSCFYVYRQYYFGSNTSDDTPTKI